MLTDHLSRRRFLALAGGAGAALSLPTIALARASEALPAAHALIDARVAAGRMAGGLAVLGRGNDPLVTAAGGGLVRGGVKTPDLTTLWRLYSMTKPVTGMAVMQLIEDGRLALDQPIADLLPEWADPQVQVRPDSLDARPARNPITVRHLLTHTAGLGYVIVTKGPLLAEYIRLGLNPGAVSRLPIPGVPNVPNAPSLEDFSQRLATLPLIAEPGTRWSYSVAFDLLGRVIEVASGRPFDLFLRERLFDPLGMDDTVFQVPQARTDRLATSYASLGGLLIPIDPAASSVFTDKPAFPYGGAGLVGTAADYDRFLRMLLNRGELDGERVLTAASADLAMSDLLPPGTDTAGTFVAGQGFGAGGRVVRTSEPGGLSPGSFGWAGAAGTIAGIDRARGLRLGGYTQVLPAEAADFQGPITRALIADSGIAMPSATPAPVESVPAA